MDKELTNMLMGESMLVNGKKEDKMEREF